MDETKASGLTCLSAFLMESIVLLIPAAGISYLVRTLLSEFSQRGKSDIFAYFLSL